MKTKARLGFILIVLFQVLILVGWTGYNEISLATGKQVVLQTAIEAVVALAAVDDVATLLACEAIIARAT